MKNENHRRASGSLRRLFFCLFLSSILFSFFSCNIEPYYILDDPYISFETKGSPSFNFFLFRQSLRLGSPVKYITLNNRDEIALFIAQYKTRGYSKKPVVSPLVFLEGKELFFQESIIPVVYNFRGEKIVDDQVGVIESKREKAFFQAGEAAAKTLNEGEFLFLFFSVETSRRRDEYNTFLEGFYQTKGKDSLIEVQITSPSMRRSEDIDNYETLIRGRSIGLYAFFSGSFNFELIDRFINEDNYFITEDYKNSFYKKESCRGSVEDNLPGLIKEGLSIVSNKSDKLSLSQDAVYRSLK